MELISRPMKAVNSSFAPVITPHAGGRKQNQGAKFRGIQIVALQVTDRAKNRKKRQAANDPVNEQAERVGAEKSRIGQAWTHHGIKSCNQWRAAAPTSETTRQNGCGAPWARQGARNITSIPNPQRTISGEILYRSWMGGKHLFRFHRVC